MELFSMHLQNAKSYFEYLKNSGLSFSYDEISELTSFENYERLLKSISVFDKIPQEDTFLYIPPSTVFDVSIYILKYIFGSSIDQNFIDDLSKRILIRDKSNIYSGALIYEGERTNKKLLFDRLDTTTSIPVFTHESTHFLYDDTPIFTNIHTQDILAMLVELISADYIEERKIDDITRYRTLVARIKDLKDIYEILTIHYPQYERYCLDTFALNLIKQFAKHTTYKYTYSFFAACNLFLCYKEDKGELFNQVRTLVDNKNAIETLLDYYNINLKSNKCTDKVINLINSL